MKSSNALFRRRGLHTGVFYLDLGHHTGASDIDDVAGLDAALDAKADDSDLAAYARLDSDNTFLGTNQFQSVEALAVTAAGNIVATGGHVAADFFFVDRSGDAADGGIFLVTDAGYANYFRFMTGVGSRWFVGKNGTAEAGANAGSDFFMDAYSDAGSWVGTALHLRRSDLAATFGGTLSAASLFEGGTALSARYAALGALAGVNTQTASYTLVLTDAGKVVEVNNAGANTLTVPPDASVAFPVATRVELEQHGAGQTTITPGAGVTIRQRESKLKLAGQYARASIYKRATNEWVLSGDLSA